LRTIADRLNYVIAECGYPDDASFMRALNRPHQNLTNWRKRGSLGTADVEIRALTGASIDFLKTGQGTPFPDGPKQYRPPNSANEVDALRGEIDELRYALAAVMGHYVTKMPDASRELAESVRDLAASPQPTGFLGSLVDYLDRQATGSPDARRKLLRLVVGATDARKDAPGP
jgi:hypothetical protein